MQDFATVLGDFVQEGLVQDVEPDVNLLKLIRNILYDPTLILIYALPNHNLVAAINFSISAAALLYRTTPGEDEKVVDLAADLIPHTAQQMTRLLHD